MYRVFTGSELPIPRLRVALRFTEDEMLSYITSDRRTRQYFGTPIGPWKKKITMKYEKKKKNV